MQHGYFVAGIEAWAVAAIFVDFVGQRGAVFDAKTEVREELRDAGEEADAGYALMFCFAHERAEKLAACAETFGCGLYDDGADFCEVRAVEVKGAATEELRAVRRL